jgi:UDP-glucose 4-epimerase
MRAIVTGGCGFIGSHLTELLLERGWSVDVVDDLSNPVALRFDGPASVYRRSASDRGLMGTLVPGARAIFHLAATVGVARVLKHPANVILGNMAATQSVLAEAFRHNVPVFIASSSEVYGRSIIPLLSEEQDTQTSPNVRWGYAAAKAVDEHLALGYAHDGLKVVIGRFFNICGPRQSMTHVLPRFIAQAQAGEPLTVFGDGHQRRSFTWVHDAVRAIVDLMDCPAAAGQIVNIGHTSSISMSSLAQLVIDIAGSRSEIQYMPIRDAYGLEFRDIEHRLADLTKIRRLIHYSPTVELDDMIRLTIARTEAHAAHP